MVSQTPVLRAFKSTVYKSPYGPKYQFQPHIAGWSLKYITNLGFKAGAFGGVALFTALFFASGIPRVKEDILQKVPFIGHRFIHKIPASDNPF